METVDYLEVLNGSADRCSLDRDNLSSSEFRNLRDKHSDWLSYAWNFQEWPELRPVEQRYFRPLFVSGVTSMAAGSEVYFPATQKYYRLLRSFTAVAAAWSDCSIVGSTLAGGSVDLSGLSGSVFLIAGFTEDPTNNGVKSGGVIDLGSGGDIEFPDGTFTGDETTNITVSMVLPAPADGNGATNFDCWAVAEVCYTASLFVAGTAYVKGSQVQDPASGWFYQSMVDGPVNGPSDGTEWGRLVPFDRYVSLAQAGETAIGVVLGVTDKNPEAFADACPVLWHLSSNGIQVLKDVPFVWVKFKVRCPHLHGDVFLSAKVYSAGSQVYFGGNFWNANQLTVAGEDPVTTPAKWDLVESPRMFARYLKHAGAGEWLSENDYEERSGDQAGLAEGALAELTGVLGQEGQVQRTEVACR